MSVIEQPTSQATSPGSSYEPRIVAFVCKWCTYAGADLAGTSRMTYPPNVTTLMLPCTGRIDISFVVRAFLQGADGVIVSGCHPGDCHYTAGNFRARRRWALFRDLLDVLGVDLNRFTLSWISAAEGVKWVKVIHEFTDKIKSLGTYEPMRKIAADHAPLPAPLAGSVAPLGDGDEAHAAPADPALVAAANELLDSQKVKAVIGWRKNSTLGRARPAWITQSSFADDFCSPGAAGNLARMLKNPMLRGTEPIAIVARMPEMLAINVLVQEAQLKPEAVQVLAIDEQGKFLGVMDLDTAGTRLVSDPLAEIKDQPVGFSNQTLAALDELMKKSPAERFAFWSEQSQRCVKCFACRGSCPMCNCETCVMDKNQPQWFATAADGPGNFAWQIVRAFHLAGRCIGCGACQDACPAGIPLNILSAAMARSALKHFEYRAGLDPKAAPLQAAFKPDDPQEFIL